LTALQQFQRMSGDTIVTPPTNIDFEALYFNFHNTVLATHPEVRQAMKRSIDQQALIDGPLHGFASPLCTDHGTFYHPGYDPGADCPIFNLVAANKLLQDNGWWKGSDGVRTRGNQRLEFEYSTTPNPVVRPDVQPILQRNFQAIGIQLDIQNYPSSEFFGPFLNGGKASPPTGAVAGRYDIAEFDVSGFGYDPDDSSVLSGDQIPSAANNFSGSNLTFYCNAALDALYQQEQAEADPGVRQQIFQQIHHIYLAQLPFITLYSPKILYIVRKGTHNYLPSPIGDTFTIWEWWCDGGKC
jgi:peptide/nickel transport system substrate-binding protein